MIFLKEMQGVKLDKMGFKRFKAIDMIKGVAMLMVILVHYNQSFDYNISFLKFFQMGCQVFFVASGFGVAVSFSKKYFNTSYKTASRSFYISRIKSIVPAWYFMMLVVYIANTFMIALKGHPLYFGYNREPLAIICNALLLNGLFPFCNNDVMPGGWYIGTTALLYLVTPPLYAIFKKFQTKGKRIACLSLSILSVGVSVLMSIVFPQTFCMDNNCFGYYFALTQFPCFALGMLLFFEVDEQPFSRKTAMFCGIIGIILMVIAVLLFFAPSLDYSYVMVAMLVGVSTYFIIKYLIYYESIREYNRAANLLMHIGKKSLYVYLVHGFFVWDFISMVKKITNNIGGGILSESILFWALIPITIFLAFYSGCIIQFIVEKIYLIVFKRIGTVL